MKTILAAALPLLLVPINLPAAVAIPPSRCDTVLAQTRSALKNVQGFKMLPHPEYNGRPPQGRTQHLIFTMGERGKSELQMATQIIRNCPQIGSVSFIINQTDDETRYGLLNGKVQPFKCKDIDETIQWGEYGCT